MDRFSSLVDPPDLIVIARGTATALERGDAVFGVVQAGSVGRAVEDKNRWFVSPPADPNARGKW
ncbi:MAG: hypothetical protein M3389_16835 [Actinomycetota bacterium]|nr:hypothetical protein [Actinomycetota bacterium]